MWLLAMKFSVLYDSSWDGLNMLELSFPLPISIDPLDAESRREGRGVRVCPVLRK